MSQRDDHRWRDHALCAETDPELFFPEVGEIPRAAMRICNDCPVRGACLTDALDTRDVSFGLRGGKTPRERQELLRARPLDRPQPRRRIA